ncbi:HtaA domain-containing protein [Modestobacter roseus]|uniref:HtaA domain-containing protein n=1 Tax=Modestobacter roseus TaxID=1181884 RepID=UPI0034DE5B47
MSGTPLSPARPGPVALPALRWGVKASFLRYLARMPDGRCSVTDGADVAADRTFSFSPDGTWHLDPSVGAAVHRFRGDVRFSGHHGLLFVRIADPVLEVRGPGGVLSICGAPVDAGPPRRLPLLTFDLAPPLHPDDPGVCGLGVRARLTSAGAEVFDLVYPEGESLDDLAFPPPPAALRTAIDPPRRGRPTP